MVLGLCVEEQGAGCCCWRSQRQAVFLHTFYAADGIRGQLAVAVGFKAFVETSYSEEAGGFVQISEVLHANAVVLSQGILRLTGGGSGGQGRGSPVRLVHRERGGPVRAHLVFFTEELAVQRDLLPGQEVQVQQRPLRTEPTHDCLLREREKSEKVADRKREGLRNGDANRGNARGLRKRKEKR